MTGRIGFALWLCSLLLPVPLSAEQPERTGRLSGSNSPHDNRVSVMIYRQGQAASALPHWWHDPQRMVLPVKQVVEQVVEQGPLEQKIIKDNHQPPSFQYLGPRGPIIQEEEPLLGLD
ncbi:hypothetical protein Pan97_53010 [Bremerella volcania]|uniref:Uncharacterized protein n=1 Tax=Bremerella volcania TaxID=2527984 RepID=A0A518CG85_9BACT|nr:hypothetical protein [Bremerella volcania]QDU78217.1 hypothetical protein Pan97_53010 [Bremerella volcania]